MSELHSPEPWTIDDKVRVHDANGRDLEYDCADGFDANDIRRIVACVNACAGIPSELLNGTHFQEIRPGGFVLVWGKDKP